MKFADEEIRLIGERWSTKLHEIKDFLSRNRVRFRWLDVDADPEARALAQRVTPGREQYPVVVLPDGSTLVAPGVRDIAAKLGLPTEPPERDWDLIIIGGGPAGVSASIYASSEGLRTLVVEQRVVGGQVTYSASIENYPGFPEAMTGSELARRAMQQSERFGTEFLVTRRVTTLASTGTNHRVSLDDGTELIANAVLLAMSVSFRWLDAPGCAPLVGAGIYYGSATAEASDCRAQDIYVLGGGNSAAQAALLLAQYARKVTIVTTDDSLDNSMSKYLVERIQATPNIEVKTRHTVAGAEGQGHLEWITLEHLNTGERERARADGLFVFIGATPSTEWLGDVVMRDEKGFVISGLDFLCARPAGWSLDRDPYALETSRAGVFVAGDVRKGSVKRLTAAAGEGAMAAQYISQGYHGLTDLQRE